MSINFHNLPQTVREPLFYAEFDPSQANTSPANLRAILIGSMLAGGTATANTPEILTSPLDAKTRFGAGSVLARMAARYRANDTFGEVWCLPLSDAGGTAATGSVAFTGPATAAGNLALYIGFDLVNVQVTSGMTAAQLATAVVAAIAANPDLVVSAVVDGGVASKVDLTAKNLGLTGNDIDVRVNFHGPASGEYTPAGMTVTIVAMNSGAANPSLTTALANLADLPFEFFASAYNDATSFASLTSFFNDVSGRWAWNEQLYGHAFMALSATYGAATTYGTAKNDPHATVIPAKASPSPTWEWAAGLCAQGAVSVRADQAQPFRDVVLQGIAAPAPADRYSGSQRNSLLFDGLSTFTVDPQGQVTLSKVITTYQLNAQGQADNSYLDVETLFNLAGIVRELRGEVTSKFGRSKLAADGTNLLPGSNVVTPKIIRGTIIAKYREQEGRGLVQLSDQFAAGLIVQKNATNPNRADVLWDGVLIDRLDVLALLAQFRLQ